MKELISALREDGLLIQNSVPPTAGQNSEVKGLAYDSREVGNGYIFIAIKGEKVDGHSFVESVLEKGAIAIVESSRVQEFKSSRVIEVKNTRKALAVLANKFYNEPSKKLKTIGVTGTFGKTTSTWLLKAIYDKVPKAFGTGLIGTIEYFIGEIRIPAHHTTPESLELQKIYAELLEKGIKTVLMEVSSHALELERVYKTDFDIAGFTTLERDHLDFHKNVENYTNAKLKLFSELKPDGIAVLNKDSHVFERFRANTKARVVSYGTTPECDVYGKLEKADVEGTEVYIKWTPSRISGTSGKAQEFKVFSPLIGGYNLSNILLSCACALEDGIEPSVICEGIKELKRVPGRFEIIGRVIIDYAHTPGALESALRYAKQLCKGRLICIFGCGGDRDTGKRSLMGKVAGEIADYVILTTDNPRSEDPVKIIKDIEQGFLKPNYEVILDRKEAIEKALERSADEDLILLAGKGHENYQMYGELKVPWDERKIVEELIKRLS